MLKILDPRSAGYNPTQGTVYTVLQVLATLCEALIKPFFNPTMSLKEQIRSLLKFAHLSFALYQQHTTSFMPGQLYGDTQAMIKNIAVVVAKQQDLDNTVPIYIIQDGNDRLEGVFSNACTDDHDPNMGIQRLCQKLSSAADQGAIFEKHPEWDRGHRHLTANGKLGADHLNPKLWKGHVVASSVSLQTKW
ncbi:hypothetical protein PAXRUDRAFT_138368, partial [Paxillus rubicundulus Ve08.2h10]